VPCRLEERLQNGSYLRLACIARAVGWDRSEVINFQQRYFLDEKICGHAIRARLP
jgi:hypothetical protein